jgi:hypothetical protein
MLPHYVYRYDCQAIILWLYNKRLIDVYCELLGQSAEMLVWFTKNIVLQLSFSLITDK